MEPKPTYQTSASSAESNRLTGTVKWFNRVKGYGFILTNDGREVFAHWRNIAADEAEPGGRRNLYDGDKVNFGTAPNPNGKGTMATDIRRLRAN